jgi:hypothetical protein
MILVGAKHGLRLGFRLDSYMYMHMFQFIGSMARLRDKLATYDLMGDIRSVDWCCSGRCCPPTMRAISIQTRARADLWRLVLEQRRMGV